MGACSLLLAVARRPAAPEARTPVTMLDERGRIAGRFNVIDVAAAVIVLVLVPLAIAAYLLFRTPAPTLVSVSPATLVEGPSQRIEVNGTTSGRSCVSHSGRRRRAPISLGVQSMRSSTCRSLKPGKYNVVLFDYAREVARLPNALTIAPTATDAELELERCVQGSLGFGRQRNKGWSNLH